MAISANVMNIETTESGTKVITLSLPDFCHTITAPENYIDGLPVIAAQPYGVIMVEDGAADDMPVVCMNNNKEFYSIALSALMAADVHDTISFATPYVFPENIDPSKYLAGLADVEITDPQNGQTLIYDATSEKWVNGNAGGGDDGTNYITAEFNTMLIDSEQNPIESITAEFTNNAAEITENIDFYAVGDLLLLSGKVIELTLDGEKYYATPANYLELDGNGNFELPFSETCYAYVTIGSTMENNYFDLELYNAGEETEFSKTISLKITNKTSTDALFNTSILNNTFNTLYAKKYDIETRQLGGALTAPIPLYKIAENGYPEKITNYTTLKNLIQEFKPFRILIYDDMDIVKDALIGVATYDNYNSATDLNIGIICMVGGAVVQNLYFGMYLGNGQ